MIPKAREVRLKPKVRQVLEARCRAMTTAQRDVKRARIAVGRSTRSIAERRRFAEHGLGRLTDRPRAGKKRQGRRVVAASPPASNRERSPISYAPGAHSNRGSRSNAD
jgi:hypothetical protein